jgi:AraC-like DNA-binding protein
MDAAQATSPRRGNLFAVDSRPRWERPRPGVRTEFTTTDPAEAHAYMRAAYVENTMRVGGSTEGFRMRSAFHDAGGFSVSWLSHTMAVEHLAQPLGYVLVGRVLLGRFERETDGEAIRAGTDDVFLVARPDRPYRAAWETMRLQLVSVDLGGLPGVPEDLEFASLQPVSAAAGQRLKRSIQYVSSAVLADREALASPLVVSGSTRLLASAVLDAFTRPRGDESAGDRHASGPATVRRAVEFVEGNAHRDVGLADIAAAARVAPRTTQLAFRRHLGMTPLGYLRRVRLERAHHDLQSADPSSETVANVRLRWGFLNADRFALAYRDVYGISPQQTLHR